MHSLLKEKLPHFDTKYVFNYYGVPMRYSNHQWKLQEADRVANGLRINYYLPAPPQEIDGIMERLLKDAVRQIQHKYGKLPVEARHFPLLASLSAK